MATRNQSQHTLCGRGFGMSGESQLDLIVLVPDNDIEQTIRGLLDRPQDLRISPITWELIKHPNHDPGCFNDGHNLLRTYHNRADYALSIFDHDGSGQEQKLPQEVEEETKLLLAKNGWSDRAEVVVIQPEIEEWIWSGSPVIDRVMGWSGLTPTLRDWLTNNGYYSDPGQVKPDHPKEAFRSALKESRKKPSAALFRQMADRVDFTNCEDRAFNRLLNILHNWFSPKEDESD